MAGSLQERRRREGAPSGYPRLQSLREARSSACGKASRTRWMTDGGVAPDEQPVGSLQNLHLLPLDASERLEGRASTCPAIRAMAARRVKEFVGHAVANCAALASSVEDSPCRHRFKPTVAPSTWARQNPTGTRRVVEVNDYIARHYSAHALQSDDLPGNDRSRTSLIAY